MEIYGLHRFSRWYRTVSRNYINGKKIFFCTIIFSSLFLTNCWQVNEKIYEYEELKLPKLNPTLYRYPVSIDKILSILKEKYSDYWINFINENPFHKYAYLYKDENSNDALFQTKLPMDSYIYYNKEYPIHYYADFYLHITSNTDSSTTIEIKTLNPRILVRRFKLYLLFVGEMPEGGSDDIEVAPSTIEEYKILLAIGEKLGMKDQMPPLILPEIPK